MEKSNLYFEALNDYDKSYMLNKNITNRRNIELDNREKEESDLDYFEKQLYPLNCIT